MRPLVIFVTLNIMKLLLTLHDTRIKNKTSKGKVVVLEQIWHKFLIQNLKLRNVKEVSVALTLCGRTKIKALNKEYRSKDKITDVLSFPIHDNLRLTSNQNHKNMPVMDLGDIFICREVALKQAVSFDISFEQEIYHLATHGFLHLLGFDHEISTKEQKLMESLEAKIIADIYKKLGYTRI